MRQDEPTTALDDAVAEEYRKRLRDGIDEAQADAFEREEPYADEIPFTQLVEAAFAAAGIPLLIRARIVAAEELSVLREKYAALAAVAATMASTLTDVVNIVEVNPDYPWRGGALKAQMREDVTAYEALGLDLPS